MGTETPDMLNDDEYPNVRTQAGTSASALNGGLVDNSDMTKEEILKALDEGKTVAHSSFTDDEWVRKLNSTLYEFEDGCVCRPQEFWRFRNSDIWDSGWRVVN